MKSLFNFNILDKFILKQIIEVFILGVVVFTSIIFASDTFISLIKQISAYGMSMNIALMILKQIILLSKCTALWMRY